MKSSDFSETVLRLHQLDDPEDAADIIDDMIRLTLDQEPRTVDACIRLIDVVISGLERDHQPRSDAADVKALRGVQVFLRGSCQSWPTLS